jgi:prephenate dehydrogenase
MAGSEKSGARHRQEELFVDRLTVVTPDDGTQEDVALRIEAFWRSLGAQVLRMTPDAHDAAVAAGEPGLWRQILLQNRRHVLETLDDFTQTLAQLRHALDTQDAEQLEQLLEAGKQTRDAYEG